MEPITLRAVLVSHTRHILSLFSYSVVLPPSYIINTSATDVIRNTSVVVAVMNISGSLPPSEQVMRKIYCDSIDCTLTAAVGGLHCSNNASPWVSSGC
jgi:hypothetical protein